MLEASPFWQNAFLVAVLVAVGWSVWNGWRIGLVRALVSMVGLLLSCLVGFGIGVAVGTIAGVASPRYGAVIGLLAGTVAGLVTCGGVSFVNGLLFKRTAQQPSSALRLVYGGGGALIGLFVGISVLWAALLFVRGMGGFCEASVEGKGDFYALPMPEPAAQALVKLKNSVEAGETGKFLKSVDSMPSEYYRLLERSGRLVADPAAMRKFLEYPAIQEVLADTRFLELAHDPEVQDLGRSQNSTALMAHPKLLDAVKDPGLLAKLQKIDIEKALDYALEAPSPTPSARPTTSHP
jgi:hypothetical protein